jgi:peptide chain release factor 2
MEQDPDFWNRKEKSAALLKEKKLLETSLFKSKRLSQTSEDLLAALELAKDEDMFLEEAQVLLGEFQKYLESAEVEHLLSGETDPVSAMVTINAGAGGTESCDWASMLLRMYMRYGERAGFAVTLHDVQDGDEAGIKSATLECDGAFAFGLLKAESGVHRLVRISPFDANSKRHTSFASVYVSPIVSDDIVIQINTVDLRIDTYRASGAGGQHINRTDSAVRITHGPSGIVVQCQSQRSQHQNKDMAMKMLRSKLYEREIEEREKKQRVLEDAKSAINFGSQIRSYVLHPYKMVKDHRTGHGSYAPDQVLDGDLSSFIYAFLHGVKEEGPGGLELGDLG